MTTETSAEVEPEPDPEVGGGSATGAGSPALPSLPPSAIEQTVLGSVRGHQCNGILIEEGSISCHNTKCTCTMTEK